MADPTTTNYGWSYPIVGGDSGSWGSTLNTTIQAIDSALHGAVIGANSGTFATLVSINAGGNLTPASPPATNSIGYLGVPITTVISNSYTMLITDAGKMLWRNGSTTGTIVIPPSSAVAYPLGTTIVIRNYGIGTVTITRGSGVTLLKTTSATSQDVLMVQYGFATLILEAPNSWLISGVGIT